MTGEKAFLDDVQLCVQRHRFTFGDSVLVNVVGKGTLNIPGLPKLTDIWLVEGWKANLISISQLTEQELCVRFNKNKCLVVDESDTCVIEGVRSIDNCYLLIPLTTCVKADVDEAELLHRKLGYVNYKSMKKAVSVDAIYGIPNLKSETSKFYGPCLEGKQVEVSHEVFQHLVTAQVLEHLLMDLMGPMQVSIGGKVFTFGLCVV